MFIYAMKIAVLADNPDPKIKASLVGADVLVTLGDLHPSEIPAVEIPHVFVYGNHDSENQPFAITPSRHDLHLQVVSIGGVTFGGFQGSRRYKPKGHYLYDDDEVASLLDGFEPVDVFVAHNPCTSLGVNDSVQDGFRAFDGYIHRAQPRLFLCGHVHRSREIGMGKTRCVSVYGAAVVNL